MVPANRINVAVTKMPMQEQRRLAITVTKFLAALDFGTDAHQVGAREP
jgi:hypothetical protein